jgi:hypothetical protein
VQEATANAGRRASTDGRVEQILARITLEEKAALMLDVATGAFAPGGKLPFEPPSSTDPVEAQRSDVPFDSADPLSEFGHGLAY